MGILVTSGYKKKPYETRIEWTTATWLQKDR